MSNNQDDDASINRFEREKWEAEKTFREREISIKEREQANKEAELDLKKGEPPASWWRDPLVIAIIAAAIAAAGNIFLAYLNGELQRQLEAQKSEYTRILEMIRTGDPDQVAENLKFLLEAGLIDDRDTYKEIDEFLKTREPGSGPALLSSEVLRDRQIEALKLQLTGQEKEALALSKRNLTDVDEALRKDPDSVILHVLKGYTLKDIYQTNKNFLSEKERRAYLDDARTSFERVLQLDPQNAGAHNGMGNVLFFEGKCDEAIKEHDRAIELMNGNYPAAEHDKRLVEAVCQNE
jgi:tetratricopeptide (TPR) repeat protein